MVPTCERATAFCAETVLTGNAVPSPSANTDSSTSNTQSGIGGKRQRASRQRRAQRPDDGDPLIVLGARHGSAGDRGAAGRNRRQRNQAQVPLRWH